MKREARRAVMVLVMGCLLVVGWVEGESGNSLPPDTRFRARKLLADLNDNPTTSQSAQAELMSMGRKVEQVLLKEVLRYREGKAERNLSAARCLRLLERMKTDIAVPHAVKILEEVRAKPNRNEQPARVLQSQAIAYLRQFFSTHPDARKGFMAFVGERRSQWSAEGVYLQGFSAFNNGELAEQYTSRDTTGWGLARDIEGVEPDRVWVEYERLPKRVGLWVNIYPGLRELVDRNEPGVARLVRKLLGSEPYVYCLCYEYLSEDGFTPAKRVFALLPESGEDADWLEPRARPRMLLMQWAGQLRDAKAKPLLSKLLRSRFLPERQRALEVLEAIGTPKPTPIANPDRKPPLPIRPHDGEDTGDDPTENQPQEVIEPEGISAGEIESTSDASRSEAGD